MNTDKIWLNELTERIIGFAFEVSNELGCSFFEKPYENALAHLCRKAGLKLKLQAPVEIWRESLYTLGERTGMKGMNADKNWLNELTEKIIGFAFEVSNELGCGFLEKPYENALAHLCRKAGLKVQQQVVIKIWFDGVIVGDYVADLLVEDSIIVETKAVSGIDEIHAAQCLNYLKATRMPLALLLNFGRPKVEVRRFLNRFLS